MLFDNQNMSQHCPGRFWSFLVFVLINCWGELAFHGLTNLRLSLKSPFSGWTVLERTTQEFKKDVACCSCCAMSLSTLCPHWASKVQLLLWQEQNDLMKKYIKMCLFDDNSSPDVLTCLQMCVVWVIRWWTSLFSAEQNCF